MMDVINKYKMVNFAGYCPSCEYYSREERMDPCNECLAVGGNIHTEEPIRYKERKSANGSKKGTRKART